MIGDMHTIEITYLVPINAISNQKARPWIVPVLVSSKSKGISILNGIIYIDHMTSHGQLNVLTCINLTQAQSCNWSRTCVVLP